MIRLRAGAHPIASSYTYTSGTDHFKHAVGPADVGIVAQYDRLAGLSDQLAERLDRTNLPDRRHDAQEVAEAIRDIVAMMPGTRPRRVDIDPQGRDVTRINGVTAELQRAFFARMRARLKSSTSSPCTML